MSEEDKLIVVKNISKTYRDGSDEIVALDDINFTMDHSESIAIVGPSGSGKTTLLEIISGLNSPTKGSVVINGKNVHKGTDSEISSFRNKTLGFVFQMMHLQDYFNALENVTLPLIASGMNKRDANERAMDLMKKVGLSKRINHYPKQLSGGEMQRVAVARALANNPRIIMADEPTGKLDRKNSDNIMDLLSDVASEGVSILLITHDEKIASRFDRIIKLDHGQIS